MNKEERAKFARLLGAEGGKNRAAKYSKKQLSAWAKQGGRPKGSKNRPKKVKVTK